MMFTQKRSAPRLHSIHALPDGSAFTGKIEAGRATYQFTFAPKSAEVSGGRLKLKGDVTVKSPAGRKRVAAGVEATLAATQGSIQPPPPAPSALPDNLRPATVASATDATDNLSSIGVLYLKLAPLDGRALGAPMDLSAVQVNARLYPQSQIERDLQWLYSAWLLASHSGNEQRSDACLREINQRFKH